MNRILTMAMVAACFVALSVTPSLADPTSGTGNTSAAFPPGTFALQALGLLVVLACLLGTARFYRMLRGGRVAQGWLWVLWAFAALACGQSILFAGHLGFIPFLLLWVDALRLVALMLFLVGITRLRKLLA